MPELQTTALNIPEGMIDLGAGQPSLSLLPLTALQAAADHCLRQGNPELLAYGTEQGDGYFRRALSEFLARRYATGVKESQLFVTASASQGLDLICTRFARHGDTIFVEQPTYFLALLTFRDHGLNVVGIPVDEGGLRIDALTDALTRHRPVFLYTIPTFQNPSAVTLSAERRQQVLALSQQHDFLIVADEVYHMLDFECARPAPMASFADTGQVFSLGSFSKICAPGLRLGWIQTDDKHVATLNTSGMVESGGGLNPFTSRIMLSMLELGHQDTCLDCLRGVYRMRSAALSAAIRAHIPTARFVEPEGGFFVWIELPGDRSASSVLKEARTKGVSFQPGRRFGQDPALDRFIRLSFAYYDEPELEEGVRRLADVLR
jgi:2-aminoadipate transaminase